jgi:hypothetical protein
MAITQYCWRCKMDVPMLNDAEWETIAPLLKKSIENMKLYREAHGLPLGDARSRDFGASTLKKYEELTGFRETNVDAIWHHQASLFGSPCGSCGKPLRTPRARFCAECGYDPRKFKEGAEIRIASSAQIEQFARTSQFHDLLRPEQLQHANRTAIVRASGIYRGDVVYQLKGVPGIWHEQLLSSKDA